MSYARRMINLLLSALVAEDGVTYYVTEDTSAYYIQETIS